MREFISSPRVPFLVGLFLILGSALSFGAMPGELRERMRERLPAIDSLKEDQLVGENRMGFLEPLESLDREHKVLIEEENEDRRAVYRHLAAQIEATAEQVGVVRARQIAERSARGVMLENEHGEWVEKR